MNQSAYDHVAGGLMQLARDIEESKRPGYTRGDEDVLGNFKRAAAQVGVSTEQAWGVFFMKHFDAILSIMTQPDLAVSEEPAQRFADAVNYLRLGYALLREREPVSPAENAPVFDDVVVMSTTYDQQGPHRQQASQPVVEGWQAAAQQAVESYRPALPVERYRAIEQTEGGFGFVLDDHAKAGPKCRC